MEVLIIRLIIISLIIGIIISSNINKSLNQNYNNNKSRSEDERIKYLNPKYYANNFRFVNKGKIEENIIERKLYRLPINKKILRNAYIPYNGSTAEIDIIMITEYGIYVIESKNYSGWIFGSEEQTYWTQSLNKNSKYKFYNPILQNQTHIKALSKYLSMNINNFQSYIVFSGRSNLKKVPKDTAYFKIMYDYRIYDYISRDIQYMNKIISPDTIEKLYNMLLPTTNVPKEIKQHHIYQMQKYK